MKSAIVSGASGFVGKRLIEILLKNDINVLALYRNISREIYSNPQYGKKLKCISIDDLEHIEDIENNIHEKIDVFYHFAWKGIKGAELYDPITQIENSSILIKCMQLAANLGCKKFVGAGSISQYENIYKQNVYVLEDRSRYYRSCKNLCEKLGLEYAQELGLEFIWPIITNMYGPGERNTERLIYNIINNLINNKVMDVSEGRQLYDFVYIDDAAMAFYLIGMKGKANRNYVIGSGNVKPLREWLEQIPAILGGYGEINFSKLPYKGAFLPEECFDITNLVDDVGYIPKVSFKEGIMCTAEYMEKINYE